jgi:hypothetical protein
MGLSASRSTPTRTHTRTHAHTHTHLQYGAVSFTFGYVSVFGYSNTLGAYPAAITRIMTQVCASVVQKAVDA